MSCTISYSQTKYNCVKKEVAFRDEDTGKLEWFSPTNQNITFSIFDTYISCSEQTNTIYHIIKSNGIIDWGSSKGPSWDLIDNQNRNCKFYILYESNSRVTILIWYPKMIYRYSNLP